MAVSPSNFPQFSMKLSQCACMNLEVTNYKHERTFCVDKIYGDMVNRALGWFPYRVKWLKVKLPFSLLTTTLRMCPSCLNRTRNSVHSVQSVHQIHTKNKNLFRGFV